MKYAALGLAVAVLGGCATGVTVQGDSYCAIAKKIRWSVRDTTETISSIRKENAKHRRICG